MQDLQWVLSGYLLTYGGFLLLGGRAADLLGRRRVLVAGTALFALSSLAAGLAPGPGTLVGARLAQGLGAAMMTPAALSILTTGFNQGADRVKALGAWGAVAGLASAVGVFLGGVAPGRSAPGCRRVSRTRGRPRPGSSPPGPPSPIHARHARRHPALLQEPRLVRRQHSTRIPQVPDHVAARRPGTHPHPTARSSAAAAARPATRPRRTLPVTTSSSARYATAAPAGTPARDGAPQHSRNHPPPPRTSP